MAQDRHEPADELLTAAQLLTEQRFAEAVPLWERLVQSDPGNAQRRLMLARALAMAGVPDRAIAELEILRRTQPLSGEVEAELYSLRQKVGVWDDYEQNIGRLKQAALESATPVNPTVLVYADNIGGALLLHSARVCARRIAALAAPLPPPRQIPEGRIRVGYISADFQQYHPVGRHMLDLFRRHDRTRFEVVGYSLKPENTKHAAFAESVDTMRYVNAETDAAAADIIREDRIEILVDLGGYHDGARLGILAHRPAPLQVNFLGYGGTTGADFVDYVVGDAVVTAHSADFSEAVARLPDTYFPGFWERPAPTPTTRAAQGLPEKAVVFCAFAANAKITPPVFAVWLDLLKQIPKSVLWLRAHDANMAARLRAHAQSAGVAPDRLVFAKSVSEPVHFGRLACADLFLDTFPYSAGSTAADALWAGLPLLTCMGDTFLSRMAASIITAAGLPDLAAPDLETYHGRALELAYDPSLLARYRDHLIARRESSALFDSPRFTRNLETAYVEMSRRYRLGERVAPIP